MSDIAAFADAPSGWDRYLNEVEDKCGRRFTDATTLDMLYTLYIGNVPVQQAVDNVSGLEHAGAAIQRVLDGLIQLRAENAMLNAKPSAEIITMKHDSRADIAHRFAPGRQVRVPRAGLIRRLPRSITIYDVVATAALLIGALLLVVWAIRHVGSAG